MKKTINLLIVFLIFISCGKKEGQKQNNKSANTIESKSSGNIFDNPDFIKKYNQYIGFGNRFHSSAIKSHDRYFSWAEREKGPKGKEGAILTIYESYISDLEKALKIEAKMQNVDKPMELVLEKAKTLHAVIEEANKYYSLGDYKDDNYVKGEELHKKLITAFDEYFSTYNSMRKEFVVLQDELLNYDLSKYKERGEHIRYNMILSLEFAKKILNNAFETKPKDIDVNQLTANIKELRTYFDELDKLKKDTKQLEKEFGMVKKVHFPRYISGLQYYIVGVKKFKERVEKNNFKYRITHPSIPDDGSPEKLDQLYGRLVTAYNSMQN